MNEPIQHQTGLRSNYEKHAKTLIRAGLLGIFCLAPMSTISSTAHARTSDARAKSTSAAFTLPFANARITSRFHQGRWHPAIDLAAPTGTPIKTTTSGQKVSFAGRKRGYGNTVITRDARGRMHLYAHLQKISARVGQVLALGQKLGTVGSTGFSTGPHLHYEVRNGAGKHVDPAPLLFPKRFARAG